MLKANSNTFSLQKSRWSHFPKLCCYMGYGRCRRDYWRQFKTNYLTFAFLSIHPHSHETSVHILYFLLCLTHIAQNSLNPTCIYHTTVWGHRVLHLYSISLGNASNVDIHTYTPLLKQNLLLLKNVQQWPYKIKVRSELMTSELWRKKDIWSCLLELLCFTDEKYYIVSPSIIVPISKWWRESVLCSNIL
jgi:hypothetical protein